jgi:hypothetical protein
MATLAVLEIDGSNLPAEQEARLREIFGAD